MKTSTNPTREMEHSIAQITMFNMGIIPIEQASFDMKRPLAEINDPVESRKMRRKFRKTWRKIIAKKVAAGNLTKKTAKATLGLGKRVPSKVERNARKKLVLDAVWHDVVEPTVNAFTKQTPSVVTNQQK